MERRSFILLAAGGIVALAMPTWFYTLGPMSRNRLLSRPQLLSTIRNSKEIAETGRVYLNSYPGESTEAALSELISKQVTSNPFMLKEELNELIAGDFKNGRIVMLDGWLLSVTEARQCALFSLTCS